ncbi:MAG: tetraacyldisaccharide 4'-kinase [Alcaligenaceae bacterium]|nr:tetraacyldisaccharide 4'-kinase [Alcaligenaceae bacterium]
MTSEKQDNKRHIKESLTEQLQQQWQNEGWLSKSLIPLSKLNGLVQRIRKILYQKNIKSSYRAPCPVIVVGNIYVGGTGKTPVVAALVQTLRDKGYHPGIISRGYGVKIGKTARVAKGSQAEAAQIGDEPALLAQYAPIGVHPKRALAIKALLEGYPQTNVIIADDGLQHLALQRDLEIVVQDERGIGNGLLLPAGPLREPADKLTSVDVIITNRNHHDFRNTNAKTLSTKPLLVDMRLQPSAFVNIQSNQQLSIEEWLSLHHNNSTVAVAGIGNPQRFFNSLASLGITVDEQHTYPDHYDFNVEDFAQFKQDIVLMTEKDALKCRNFADNRFYFLKVNAEFSDKYFFDKIEQLLKF